MEASKEELKGIADTWRKAAMFLGFWFGIGFGVAGQLTWWMFDWLKGLFDVLLG